MAVHPFPAFDDDARDFANDARDFAGVSAGVFIHDDTHPRVSIVSIFGESTFADTPELESFVVSVVRIGRPLIIDLRECSYMDCATIGVIVRAAKNLGDQLRIVIPRRSQGYRMLELTGLARVLHLFESIEAAAAPIEAAAPPSRLRIV
jgi:anti-anti-sigma factor